MYRIHVARDRKIIGQFTPQEVAEGLRDGTFQASDLAWREPMDAWKPLGEFSDLPAVEPPELPPPLTGAEPPEPEKKEAEPLEPAWERRAELGFFPAVVETIRQIYSAPAAAFRAMAVSGGYRSPLLFYLVLATCANWASTAYELTAVLINPEPVTRSFNGMITPEVVVQTQIASFFLIPLFLIVKAFLAAGVYHGILSVLGGAKHGYEATFRAYCYAGGAASIMLFIPVCGKLVAIVLTIGLVVIAVREAHRTNMARAAGSVLPAVIIGYALLVAAYAVVVAAGQSVIK